MTVDDHDDTAIRQALRETFGDVAPTRAADLEQAIDARVQQRTRRRHTTRGIAALACVTGILAVIAVGTTGDQEAKVTTGPPESTDESGFPAWGPGWHELDTGPVPASMAASSVWTGDELIVAAGRDTFAYDPTTREWTTIGPLPFADGSTATLVAASDHVVAVSDASSDDVDQAGEAAVLDLGGSTSEWEEIAGPATSESLVAAGTVGPRGPGRHGLALLWTGERVIDLTRGAVLDPDGWEWEPIELPTQLASFTHLLGSIPVWDGTRVVLVAASTGPGLTWDATGGDLQEISGIPLDQTAELGGFTAQAAVTSDEDGSVVVVGYLTEGSMMAPIPAWRLDTASTTWSPLPSVRSLSICSPNAAAVGGSVLVPVCYSGLEPGIVQLTEEWTPIDPLPESEVVSGTWTSTSDALVVWSAFGAAPDAPGGPRAWVWVPGSSGAVPTTTTTSGQLTPPLDPVAADAALAALGPGWHEIDTGPVVVTAAGAVAWTGAELVVIAGSETLAYAPETKAWRELPDLPFEMPDHWGHLVWTGTHLVALVSGSNDAAVLDPASGDDWETIDGPVVPESVREAGGALLTRGMLSPVWTGERVIDPASWNVLDPATWTWSPLALPSPVFHSGLRAANRSWDGTELIAAPTYTEPGLAWNATGTSVREIPGIPTDLLPTTNVQMNSVTTSPSPGTVVAWTTYTEYDEVTQAKVLAEGKTNAWSLDVASGVWTSLPRTPELTSSEGCPWGAASVAGYALFGPCFEGSTPAYRDGRWISTGGPPQSALFNARWVTADRALFSSSATFANQVATDILLYVWIPPS